MASSCEGCQNEEAVWHCDECEADYCDECWPRLHRVGKLKNHTKAQLNLQTRTIDQPMDCTECTLHAMYWCESCEVGFCAHCKVSTHTGATRRGHTWFLLRVASETGDVAPTFDEVDKIYQHEQTELVHINEKFQVALTTKTFERCLTRSKHSVFSPVVCFTGATHAGKSTMINAFMDLHSLGKRAMVALPKDHAATTSDIHLYHVPNPWTVGNLRLLDMEGFSASNILPRGIRWDRLKRPDDQQGVAKQRNLVVDKVFPSLAYFVADILVYVLQGDLAVAEHANKAMEFAQSSATTLVTDAGRKPALIIVRNKCGKSDAIFDVDDCTTSFLNTHDPKRNLLNHFASVNVISVPYNDWPSLHQQQIQSFDKLLKSVTAQQYQQLTTHKHLLSEHSWCKLLQHAVDRLAFPETHQSGLRRGDIDMKLITFNNPIAHQTWLLMKLLDYHPSRYTYMSFEKQTWHVFTSLVKAEESKQQHGEKRSLANDPLVKQAGNKLSEALQMLSPCWAEHTGTTKDGKRIYCTRTNSTHQDCRTHISRPLVTRRMAGDSFFVRAIKCFQLFNINISMTVEWGGTWETPPTFSQNHFDTIYAQMQQETEIRPVAFSVLKGIPQRGKAKVQLPEDLNCLFCLLKPRQVAASCKCKLLCQPCAVYCLMKKEARNYFSQTGETISLIKCPICLKGELKNDQESVLHQITGLTLGKNIGSGSYANVYLAERKNEPSTQWAIKVAMIHNFESQKAFWKEATMMKQLSHKHIMCPVGYWKDPAQGDRLGLVLPFIPGGDARQMIRTGEFGKDWQTNLHRLAKHVAKALSFLHQTGVVHCDVKLSNILVDRGREGKLVFKLTDFGIAKRVMDKESREIKKIRGTVQYMAPELFDFQLSTAVDMYAYGVLIYEAAHGRELWPGDKPAEVMAKAQRNERPTIAAHVPAQYAEMITSCWPVEAKSRSSAAQVLNHYLKQDSQSTDAYPDVMLDCETKTPTLRFLHVVTSRT